MSPSLPREIALLSAALDNLIRHVLTGCAQSAQRTAMLLDRIESDAGTDRELLEACQRMRQRLEERDV